MATIALRAARKAADIMVRSIDRLDTIDVEEKAANDLVSQVDRDCEASIIEALHSAYPDHGIIGEEHGEVYSSDAEYTWIIDPLDGTTNYLHGIPHFAVSIAARRGRQLEHGVIVAPMVNEEFVASRGKGASLNGKRIRVRNRVRLDKAIVASGLPPALQDQRIAPYSRMLVDCTSACAALRRTGSAALDLAYVAAGRFDGVWEPGLKPWDIAAGAVLVREAGGFVGDMNGGDRFMEDGHILAANPKLFRALVNLLRPNARELLG